MAEEKNDTIQPSSITSRGDTIVLLRPTQAGGSVIRRTPTRDISEIARTLLQPADFGFVGFRFVDEPQGTVFVDPLEFVDLTDFGVPESQLMVRVRTSRRGSSSGLQPFNPETDRLAFSSEELREQFTTSTYPQLLDKLH